MPELESSAINRLMPKVLGDLAPTTYLMGIGDSITSKAGLDPLWADVGYLSWVYLLGNGRYRRVAHAGAGGYTTAQIVNEMLPQVFTRSPRPTHVLVLAGTNDAGATSPAIPLATTAANLTTIYTTLRANGITPICCSIPPRLDALAAVHKINEWVYRYAQANGLPYVDIHAVLTDPTTGGYVSGYGVSESPVIHPSAVGAKLMGQAVVTVLDKIVRPMDPPLIVTKADPGSLAVAPLFLSGFTDADADSLPDGVGSQYGLGLLSGGANVGVTYANASGGDIVGRWLELTLNATSPLTGFNMVFWHNLKPTVSVGDRIAFGFKAKLSGSGSGTSLGIWLSNGGASASYLTGDGFPLYQWSQDFGPNTVYGECVVPSGMTTIRLNCTMAGVANQKVSLAQLHIKNLTALGIA